MNINTIDMYYRSFFIGRKRHFGFKLKEFSESIKPLCKCVDETIDYLSDTAELDQSDASRFTTQLKNPENYLEPTYKSILQEIKGLPSLEKNPYIANIKTKLGTLQSEITLLQSSVRTPKDILSNFYKYYVEQLVPINTEESKVSRYHSDLESTQELKLKKTANERKLKELQRKCNDDLSSLQSFISKYTEHIKEFDTKLKEPCSCIKELITNSSSIKSEIKKDTLIDYIINLIDTTKFIISVEPSVIVNHLKPLYSIKPEIECMIRSIKVEDIEKDIINLQSLYSEIVNIQSFSRNMKKLKDYLSSVESHIRPINQILTAKLAIENIICSKYLNLVSSELLEDYCKISKYKSKLKDEDPVKKYMDELKNYIKELNDKVLEINCNINKIEPLVTGLTKKVEFVNNQINCIRSDIRNLECAIEAVVRNTVRCSLQYLFKQLR